MLSEEKDDKKNVPWGTGDGKLGTKVQKKNDVDEKDLNEVCV